jgi:hypothetical protein
VAVATVAAGPGGVARVAAQVEAGTVEALAVAATVAARAVRAAVTEAVSRAAVRAAARAPEDGATEVEEAMVVVVRLARAARQAAPAARAARVVARVVEASKVVARVAEATQVDLAEAVADWVVVEAKVPAIQTTADRLLPMLLLGKLQPAPGIDVTWLHTGRPYRTDSMILFIICGLFTSQRIFGRTRIPHLNKEIC